MSVVTNGMSQLGVCQPSRRRVRVGRSHTTMIFSRTTIQPLLVDARSLLFPHIFERAQRIRPNIDHHPSLPVSSCEVQVDRGVVAAVNTFNILAQVILFNYELY